MSRVVGWSVGQGVVGGESLAETRQRPHPSPRLGVPWGWPNVGLAQIPFLLDTLQVDEHTIIIGHSSGAVAAMRLAEKQPVLGIVLVAACHTDLGMKSERVAGYYSRPWLWDKIKENAGYRARARVHAWGGGCGGRGGAGRGGVRGCPRFLVPFGRRSHVRLRCCC